MLNPRKPLQLWIIYGHDGGASCWNRVQISLTVYGVYVCMSVVRDSGEKDL